MKGQIILFIVVLKCEFTFYIRITAGRQSELYRKWNGEVDDFVSTASKEQVFFNMIVGKKFNLR